MLWFIVLLLVLGGGFYVYYKLKEIEQQIRDEQAQEKEKTQQEQQQPSELGSSASGDSHVAAKSAAASVAKPVTETEEQQAGDKPAVSAPEAAILESIQNQPGIVQSDLYPQFPAMNKKRLQELIKRMADEGNITRESYRSSYRLYPV
jgi:uncharacterized membrane protein